MSSQVNKVILIVLDGWGLSENTEGNAIRLGKTPNMDYIMNHYAFTSLQASGKAVGLPAGLMGNSEVGHLNLGAGRIVYQDIVRIDLSIENNSLKDNPVLLDAIQKAKQGTGRVHFLGLLSDGGVHSHIQHLFALLRIMKAHGVPNAFVHAFTDGRDTSPTSGVHYVQDLVSFLDKEEYGSLSTIIGRYYAMDRDNRWERIERAFNALTLAIGEHSADPIQTMKTRYSKNETDEFLKPIIVNENGIVKDGDVLIFFDFRADRMRQIVTAFGLQPPFSPKKKPENLKIYTMTEYKKEFPFPVLFPPESLDNVIAEWLAKKGLKQFHVSETEKYAHVTFFFNGGREEPFQGEDRLLIPSPKVATYDLKPEMSVFEVSDAVVKAMEKDYAFIITNFATPDMVGHTGIIPAVIKAVEAADTAVGKVLEKAKETGHIVVVTADHGNAEQLLDEDGKPHTAHTTNPVPFIIVKDGIQLKRVQGKLGDIAPTILALMNLEIPKEMTGTVLIET